MKIAENTESRLVLLEPGPYTYHWGYLALILSSAALIVFYVSDKPAPLPAVITACVFLVMGFIAAFFMRKRLRHVLDRQKGTLTVEYPENMGMSLEVQTARLDDIDAVSTEKRIFLRSAGTPGPSHKPAGLSLGFHYTLKDGKVLESGLYSSIHEEIEDAVAAVRKFLGFPEG